MAELRYKAKDFQSYRAKDDGCPTISSTEQAQVEDTCDKIYTQSDDLSSIDSEYETLFVYYIELSQILGLKGKAMDFTGSEILDVQLLPEFYHLHHYEFLKKGLEHLSTSYTCLDASRTWLCYWILHGLELIGKTMPEYQASQIVRFISQCQHESGGYGGGPGQAPHLAPTYAAVNALCIIGTEEAYKSINRSSLYKFLMKMRMSDGSFKMHEDGEVDIRGAYCAASAARLTNVATPELFDLTPEWIVRCQTYEGGFGGAPMMEAHGGYSFCGLAALMLMGKEQLCDIKALLRWTVNRQMSFEGGFQGRTNKLVDGCYSFWQGGALPLIHMILTKSGDGCLSTEAWMFHQGALQEYLLKCCQHKTGGFIDKPGKLRDYYHTCYCLSGLSVAQHFTAGGGHLSSTCNISTSSHSLLKETHPVLNIGLEAAEGARQYFSSLEKPSSVGS